jgi:hypothetical protein
MFGEPDPADAIPVAREELGDGAMLAARRLTTKRVLVLVGVLALIGLGLVTLIVWPSVPHGGLSQADAVQIAWRHADSGAVAVVSAEVRGNFNTEHDRPIHRWAWVVTFSGQWHLLCQGAAEGCDPRSEWVAIDYYTGEWIASQHSYPSHRKGADKPNENQSGPTHVLTI